MVVGRATVKPEKDNMREILEFYSKYKRASQGLPLEPKSFDGMIDVNRIEERTRLDLSEILEHSYERMLYKHGGEEWRIMLDFADIEDHYFISKEGLQRVEWVEMTKAKNTMNIVTGIEPQQPEEQKGRLARIFQRGESKSES